MTSTLTIKQKGMVIASLVVSVFLFGPKLQAEAATVSSAANGNWTEPTTWTSVAKTGKISFTDDSLTVLGTETLFTSELVVGSLLRVTVSRGIALMTVAEIIDDNHLIVAEMPEFDSGTPKNFTASAVPRISDAVIISSGDQVRVNESVQVASLSFPTSNNGTSTLTIDASATLTVSGALTIPRASSPAFNVLDVGDGNLIAGTIAFTSGGTVAAKRHQLWIGNGLVKVGNVTQSGSSGSVLINFLGNGKLQVAGAFLNKEVATLMPGLGTIEYNGEGVQTVGEFDYYNLILSGMLIKTMVAGTEIAGELSIAPTGNAQARLVIGQQIRSGTLILGGVARKSGVWGASDSLATYKEDVFFAPSSGTLLVSGGLGSEAQVTIWPSASEIIYGQSVGQSNLSGGVATVPGTFAWKQSEEVPSQPGSISREVIFRPNDTGAYDEMVANVQLVVRPKTVEAIINVADKIYDGAKVANLISCQLEGVVGDDEVSCAIDKLGFVDANVGVDKLLDVSGLYLSGQAASKYIVVSQNEVRATIEKKVVAIKADGKSKLVGESDPIFTYGIQAGEILEGDVWSGALWRASGEAPGSYAINIGDLKINDNYELQFSGADLVISERAVVEVVVNDQIISYGQEPSLPSFEYVGLVEGDDESVIDVPPSCSINGDYSQSGVYAVVCSGAIDDSYEFSYRSGTLTVNKAQAQIDLNNLKQSYDGKIKPVSASTNPADLKLIISYNGSEQIPKLAGNYVVLVRVDDNNYQAEMTANLQIDQAQVRALGVKVQDQVYDGLVSASLDVADVTLEGIINDDEVLVDFSASQVSFEDKNVGADKAVQISGVSLSGQMASNYKLTAIEATGQISQREISVKAVSDVKDFDGTVSSTKAPILIEGELAVGDSAQWWQTFESASVGDNKILVPGGVINDGNAGMNYLINWINDQSGVIKEKVATQNAGGSNGGGGDQLQSPAQSSGHSSGVIISGYCQRVVYGEWSDCQSGKQSRVISSREPVNCQLTPSEQEGLTRVCGQALISEAQKEVLGVKLYPDGSFLKGAGVKIYWIIKGAKYHVKNLAELWSYKPKRVIRVTDEVLAAYPDRANID